MLDIFKIKEVLTKEYNNIVATVEEDSMEAENLYSVLIWLTGRFSADKSQNMIRTRYFLSRFIQGTKPGSCLDKYLKSVFNEIWGRRK